MHDGSLKTLDAVIDHSAGGKLSHPNKSPILRAFVMTDQDKKDLIEFLQSLTDTELLHDARWTTRGLKPVPERSISPFGASLPST